MVLRRLDDKLTRKYLRMHLSTEPTAMIQKEKRTGPSKGRTLVP